MTNTNKIKTFTILGHCKYCGEDFTYTRLGDLRGTARTVCDSCYRGRNRDAKPNPLKVVSEE